jgi:hypothetical protein
MPSQYNLYVANFNRVRLSEMLDRHEFETRRNRVKASLVVNPLSGYFYGEVPAAHQRDVSSVPV